MSRPKKSKKGGSSIAGVGPTHLVCESMGTNSLKSSVSSARSRIVKLSDWQKDAVILLPKRPKGFKVLLNPQDVEGCEKMAAGLLIFPSTVQFELFMVGVPLVSWGGGCSSTNDNF